MDEIHEFERWINNLFQKFESLWEELEEFKEPVSYYGRVSDSVKKLYSDAVQEIPLRDSNSTDLVETSTSSNVAFKEHTVQSNISKIKEAPLVPTEFCREQITSEISGCSVQQGDSLIKKDSNKDVPVHLYSFTNSQEDVGSSKCKISSEPFMHSGCVMKKYDADHSAKILNELSENYFDNRSEEEGIFCDVSSVANGSIFQDADWDIAKLDMYNDCIEEKCGDDGFAQISNELSGNQFSNTEKEEGVLCNASLETDASTFEHADWGLPYMVKLNLGTTKMIEADRLVNMEEKKKKISSCILEPENDSDTSRVHQSSEPESAGTCNQSSLSPEKLFELSNSSSKNFTVEPDKLNCNPTEVGDSFSVSSHGVFLCGPFTVLGSDYNSEGSLMSISEIGSLDVDFEDLKMDTVALSTGKQPVESCVIDGSGKRPALPSSKIKSYKKMIKDAFMLRTKITKEYKKMPISYADIDEDLSQLTEETIPKSPAQKLIDFDWELV